MGLAETRRWSCEESKRGKKWKERVVGKAAGDERVFIPGRASELADGAPPTPIPATAGGELVTRSLSRKG